MAGTLDFAVDLTDKLQSQGFSHILVVMDIKKDKEEESTANVFYYLKNKKAKKIAQFTLQQIAEEMDNPDFSLQNKS